MLIINAKFEVQSQAVEQYEALIKDLVASSRQETGNIGYEHFKSTESDNTYLMYEIWESQEAIEAHNNSEHFQQFIKSVKPLLAGPSDIKVSASKE